jgi:hypothetical protein
MWDGFDGLLVTFWSPVAGALTGTLGSCPTGIWHAEWPRVLGQLCRRARNQRAVDRYAILSVSPEAARQTFQRSDRI